MRYLSFCDWFISLSIMSMYFHVGDLSEFHPILKLNQGLPCGLALKSLPCNAGDAGSIPGQQTKVPHAAEKLSPSTTTTEPAHSGVHEQ